MTKIVKSEVWNRALVCFRSDPVDSRQRADMRAIYFDDRLVGRSSGKNKIAFHFLKPSGQDRTSLLGERDFASGCLCLSERVEGDSPGRDERSRGECGKLPPASFRSQASSLRCLLAAATLIRPLVTPAFIQSAIVLS